MVKFKIQKSRLKSFGFDFLRITCACFIFYVLCPLAIMSYRPEEHKFINIQMLLDISISAWLMFSIGLGLISICLHILKMKKFSENISFFLLFYSGLSVFALPVSKAAGVIAPLKNPVDSLNLISALLISFVLVYMQKTRLKPIRNTFFFVFIFASAFISFATIKSEIIDKKKVQVGFSLSKNKNIIVMGFDGVPAHILEKILEEDTEAQKILKDFIFYKNAKSQSFSTLTSIMGEMYGTRDFKSFGSSTGEVKRTLKQETKNLLILQEGDIQQHGFQDFPAKKIVLLPEQQENIDNFRTRQFYSISVNRFGTRYFLNYFLNQTTGLDALYDPKDYIVRIKHPLIKKMETHFGEPGDRRFVLEMIQLEALFDEVKINNTKESVRYMHWGISHHPIDFDDFCEYRSNEENWFKANQNYRGILNQSKCVASIMKKFVLKLKELNVYDNSLIVFRSDHGDSSYYFNAKKHRLMMNGNIYFGFNQYHPMLLIKDQKQIKKQIEVRNETVLLNDLAKTLCLRSVYGKKCELFPGVDLLGEDYAEDLPYYLYAIAGPHASYYFKYQKSYLIPSRKLDLLEYLKNNTDIKFEEYKD